MESADLDQVKAVLERQGALLGRHQAQLQTVEDSLGPSQPASQTWRPSCSRSNWPWCGHPSLNWRHRPTPPFHLVTCSESPVCKLLHFMPGNLQIVPFTMFAGVPAAARHLSVGSVPGCLCHYPLGGPCKRVGNCGLGLQLPSLSQLSVIHR